MRRRHGRYRHGGAFLVALALGALALGGLAAASCNLIAGVDDLKANGPCDGLGDSRCNGNTPEDCGADGQWSARATGPCVDSVCDQETHVCVGVCQKGQRRCGGITPQRCNAGGQWEAAGEPCETSCAGGECITQACTPGDLSCSDQTPQLCDAQRVWQVDGPKCLDCLKCDDTTGTCASAPEAGCVPRPAMISAGRDHTCALIGDGSVKCWGRNTDGELGLGDAFDRGDAPDEMGGALPPVDLGKPATAIASGLYHTCALFPGGTVKCWGNNASGQLGLGDVEARGDQPDEMGKLPPVDLGKTAVALAAGASHTCALLSGGAVKCWGYNGSGQLGLGDMTNRGEIPGQMGSALPAVSLGKGLTATALAAGNAHTCALLAGGLVKCWGENGSGQLGLGDTKSRGDGPGQMGDHLAFVDLGLGEVAVAIAAGGDRTCAILTNGRVKCWGGNDRGQLGLGDTNSRGNSPGEMGADLPVIDLGAGQTAAALTLGAQHTCALLKIGDSFDSGPIKCWGNNDRGQLGRGNIDDLGGEPGQMGDKLEAIDLGAGASVSAATAGDGHTCALLSDKRVKCWGANDRGQLGLGNAEDKGSQPGQMGDALPPVEL